MCVKRLKNVYRKPFVPVMQTLMPVCFTWFVVALVEMRLYQSHPPLRLSLSLFGRSTVVYDYQPSNDSDMMRIADSYKKQFDTDSHELIDLNKLSGYTDGVNDYLLEQGNADRNKYSYHHFVAAEFRSLPRGGISAIAFYNNEAFHTSAISLSLVDNALLQYYAGPGYSIETTNHPRHVEGLPSRAGEIAKPTQGMLIIFGLVMALPVAIASYVIFTVKERALGAKNAHFISGLRIPIYWAAMFACDYLVYIASVVLIICMFFAYDIQAFIASESLFATVLMFLLYGWAILPMMYAASFMFKSPGIAMTWTTIFNLVTGERRLSTRLVEYCSNNNNI